MKRVSVIACIMALIVMLGASVCFADKTVAAKTEDTSAFQITSVYPTDGQKNTTKDNMCVKVYFNNEVGNAASKKANADKFKFTDESGKEYPSLIAYNKSNPKYVLIMIDTNKVPQTGKNAIKDDTVYTCTISEDFVDNAGNKLGDDAKRITSFSTMNQSRNTIVYMVMMFVMFGGMMVFTMRQNQKKQEKDKGDEKEAPFNPYKVAKETGKSVEDVIAAHEKEVKKKEAAKKAKAKRDRELDEYFADEEESNSYKVKGPRPISAAGATYKTGRKAIAEAKAAEAAAKKAELKATNYGKNPKGAKKRK